MLLRVRFEKSLKVYIDTSDEYQEYLLPTFVLQLLIENAVKHNIISGENPLSIRIFTDCGGNLHVDNNLQLKAKPDISDRTGLANIRSRYALLNKEHEFHVINDNNSFKVSIPLLEINRYATTHLITI